MKASELIKEIQKMIDDHGDKPVFFNAQGRYGGQDGAEMLFGYQEAIEPCPEMSFEGFREGFYFV